jgi:cysteinyl-tRNA synthetase
MSFVRLATAAAALMLAPWLAATDARAQGSTRPNPFANAKSWAYQLKNLVPAQRAKIAASDYDVMVVDYAESSDFQSDTDELPLTREQVAEMQKKPDGAKRVVIAYLSIGESENYRYYWKRDWNARAPAWKDKESKEWKGNFLVRYWDPDWQRIIFGGPDSYVDRILAAGFDGFYIDRADAYYRYGDTTQARDRMTDFVTRLIAYIRSKKPDAAIMIQNAEELLDRPKFVDAIDAIAKEDLVFGITHREERNKQAEIDWSNNLLRSAQAKGKRIFVVEYLVKPQNIAAAKDFMAKNDYVLYYGPRGLFEITDKGAGPRRGADDPTPPTASQGIIGKTKEKAAELKQKAKATYDKAKQKAKELVNRKQEARPAQ